MKYRYILAGAILSAALYGIGYLFWHNELIYSLPTPVPTAYAKVNTGEVIDLFPQRSTPGNKPRFVHFFNPDCPCSRFNLPHFKTLIRKYGKQVDFAVVVMNKNAGAKAAELKSDFPAEVMVLSDSSMAARCGVYSTPQAVILDENSKLFYRGNYNKSRYCTEQSSNYAEIALDSLLTSHVIPVLAKSATIAYGCQLPANCTK